MALIKTHEQYIPAAHIKHDECGNTAEVVGVWYEDDNADIWYDLYWCPHCKTNFMDEDHPLWCDADTGDFYAYREAVSDAK